MFHLRAKIIGRSGGGGARSAAGASAYRTGGRNGAASMAYRAGEALRDPLTGKTFDYSRKAMIDADGFGILHSEIMLPVGAPAWMADRQALIDAIEAKETRADAQLLREIEVSLPRELTFEQQRALIRAFVQEQFVARGMIADLAIHDERASDGGRNPHAHVLLTMRSVSSEGFGKKERAWNSPDLLRDWRQAWADMANHCLAELGHERRLDARSHRDRGISLEPDIYVGPSLGRRIDGVLHAERQESRDAARQENIDRIIQDPGRLIDIVAREKATFTAGDIGYALRRATSLDRDDPLYHALIEDALDAPDLVAIATDRRGATRYATRDMIACETEMARAAAALAGRETIDSYAAPSGRLSLEQKQAFLHATQGPDLIAISGVAGAGKTTTLAAIAAAFEASGHCVRGAALAGVAARNLRDEAGIPAATLAGTFYGWDRTDRDGRPDPIAPLEKGDVFILDEAGLVGSRDMRRLLAEAERVQAKVILVGDAQQLQAIEAGSAFRAIADTHGAVELREVHRQRADWQRSASEQFSQGRAAEAMASYRKAGALHPADSTQDAIAQLVDHYVRDRQPEKSQVILAHARADVRALNEQVREALRAKGELGPDVKVTIRDQERDATGAVTERARRTTLAIGDRILFTKNDRGLDVQNGTTATIRDLDPSGRLVVDLTDGRQLGFSLRDYAHVTHGHAMTVHKAQGATYDKSYVLATGLVDAHIGYVAMTRHREETHVYYGRDQFERDADLDRAISRQRPKDSTLDYLADYRDRARDRKRGDGDRDAPRRLLDRESSAPLSAAERIRQNVAQRRETLSQSAIRDRSYGE
ncbi:MAG: Ti-type conjugative transfer relaxase TraA [Chloroflexi bacterium]|nr:Ti-type conjugative transfer relaxase TraA [Chloroflexota bacterium]